MTDTSRGVIDGQVSTQNATNGRGMEVKIMSLTPFIPQAAEA